MSALLEFSKFTNLNNWSVLHLLQNDFQYNKNYELVKMSEFLTRNKTNIIIDDKVEYKRVTIKQHNNGLFLRDIEIGKNIGTKKQFSIKKGQFLLSKIDARNGAFGVVSEEIDNAIITGNFWTYDVNYNLVNPYFLALITTTKQFMKFCQMASSGTTGRHYLKEDEFLDVKIPLPPLNIQKRIVQDYQDRLNLSVLQELQAEDKEKEIEQYLYTKLDMNFEANSIDNILDFVNYKTLTSWSYRDLLGSVNMISNSFDTIRFNQKLLLVNNIFRGKSPKYSDNSNSIILNQKCNRWNNIEIQYSKSVEDDWISKVDKKFFTQENDIIINSTGDGTIGRATYITKKFANLLYDSHILLLRVNKKEINALFLTYYINSPYGQSQIENIKSAIATKQTELGINNLKNIQFIIPPLEIQDEIVNHIKILTNEINTLKEQSIKNKDLALIEFEKEIFNEA